MKAHPAMFAASNAWAKSRFCDAAAALSDELYRADRGTFFRSGHGTLDHLLAADRIPLGPALAHLFNHHTHHRGQVHALLTGLTGTAPALDLIVFQRETGIGMA